MKTAVRKIKDCLHSPEILCHKRVLMRIKVEISTFLSKTESFKIVRSFGAQVWRTFVEFFRIRVSQSNNIVFKIT